MNISCSIDMKSTPEIVFGWLEKPEKAMAWMTSVSKTEILHEAAGMVGTTFRETLEEEGNTMEMQGEITGFAAGKSIMFHLSSRVNTLDVTYAVEPIPGGTRVAVCADIRWKFPVNIYGIFLGEKLRQNIMTQLRSELGRLKQLCEEETSR